MAASGISGVDSRTILGYLAFFGLVFFFFSGRLSGVSQDQQSAEREDTIPVSTASLVYPDPSLECRPHPVDIHIFSSSPLIIYVPAFLSKQESEHMISIRYEYC